MNNNRFHKAVVTLVVTGMSFIACAEDFYKETRRSIKVNSNVRLDMDISYADVTIQTWDQQTMEIVVKQNVNARTENRANEIFESITVNISESPELVGLVVTLGNYSCNGNSESYDITVDVKMPASGATEGSVSFGDIHIGDLKGPCELHVEYGSLRANSLMSKENDVEMAFGDATIQTTAGGDFQNEYGELKIKKLVGNAEFKSAFGDLEIDHVSKDVKSLDIKIEYGDAEIDLAPGSGYHFDAQSSYGELSFPDNTKKSTDESDYTSRHMTGTVGSGGGQLKIECDFGDVEIDFDVE